MCLRACPLSTSIFHQVSEADGKHKDTLSGTSNKCLMGGKGVFICAYVCAWGRGSWTSMIAVGLGFQLWLRHLTIFQVKTEQQNNKKWRWIQNQRHTPLPPLQLSEIFVLTMPTLVQFTFYKMDREKFEVQNYNIVTPCWGSSSDDRISNRNEKRTVAIPHTKL